MLALRRGYLLAEALCALALAGALAATAVAALSGAQRARRAGEERERAGRAERETIAVLRAALEGGHVVALRGDTAVDLDLAIALAPICGVEPRALLLPPVAVADRAPLTAALQAPGPDDIAAVRMATSPHDPPTWAEFVVDSAQLRMVSGRCDASDGWAAAADASSPRWRLTFRDSLPADLEPGTTVRIGRPGRFTLYHAGNGEWMLGWRRCTTDFAICGVVQPIAGPLRTPAAGGLRIRAFTDPARWEIEARGAGSRQEVARATVHQ